MSGSDLYRLLMDRLGDPYTRGRIRRALGMDLVLDTWLNGEREESFTEDALEIISQATEELTRQAMETGAIFPDNPMPEGYIRSVFQEFLSSTALYQAQKYKGIREVGRVEAAQAETILRHFVASERDGLTSVAGMYFVISAHEDLNAIHYYRRMKREDFLLGALHRPWSDMMLTNQLDLYQGMGLVIETFAGDGETLELTEQGVEILHMLRRLLEETGEFEWRANAQRWVIFGETNYDRVFNTVFPNIERLTREFLDRLNIPPGARVLEIGAGTGRVTLDIGLADRVTAAGGQMTAMEPAAALLNALREKCRHREITGLELVQGKAEDLPFPNNSFDLVVSVAVLHFTELEQAVREMVRVTKPGGQVAAYYIGISSIFNIQMVSLWFRPLKALANGLQMPLGEFQGLLPDDVEAVFRKSGMSDVHTHLSGAQVVANDHRAFLQFVLKGAALFQDLLSRVPYAERWRVIQQVDETGADFVANTTDEEKQMVYPTAEVFGTVSGMAGCSPEDKTLPVPMG